MKNKKTLISAYIDTKVLEDWNELMGIIPMNKSQLIENKLREFIKEMNDKLNNEQ